MRDTTNQYDANNNALFTSLGELRANITHVLLNMERLAKEQGELEKKLEASINRLSTRLSELETFQTKTLAIAGVVIPFILVVLEYGLHKFLHVF